MICTRESTIAVACLLSVAGCGRAEVPPAVYGFEPVCGTTSPIGDWARVQTLSGEEDWDDAPGAAAHFGGKISFRPTTLLVGASSADGEAPESGAVYLYGDSPRIGTWIPNNRLMAEDGSTGAGYGRAAVSTTGMIAIAAPDDGDNYLRGSVYLYRLAGVQRWELSYKFDTMQMSGAIDNLAFDGDALLIGRNAADVLTAYGTTGVGIPELWSLDAPADHTRWGVTVARDEDVLVVGDDWYPRDGGDHGAVTVYQRSAGGPWVEPQLLTEADAGRPIHLFGTSLAVVGDRVFVGSAGDEDNGFGNGSVYVFRRVAGTWQLEQRLGIPLDEQYNWDYFHFGRSVAASGTTLVVGAPNCRTPSSVDTGCVSVYRLEGGTWSRVVKIYPFGPSVGSRFGSSVALCGNRLAIGAPGVAKVFLYELR